MSEFLAEGRVLITPDTTSFRTQLETQLTAATKGVVVPVPVTVAPVATGAAAGVASQAAANEELNASLQKMGVEQVRTERSTRSLTAAQTAQAAAAKKLAFADQEVATAATEVTAAQVQATRSIGAVAAAERAVTLARQTGNAELIRSTELLLVQTQTLQAEKVAALDAARAQAAHAAALANVSKAGIASGASLLGLRGAVLTAGAAFLGATVAFQAAIRSIGQFAALETSLNVFKATTQATAEQMKQVSETAKQLGRDITLPAVSAGDAATAMTELAKAGLSVSDSMAAARGTLQLATAAQIDNVQATQLVASALNAFALNGEEAVRVADLLTGASNEAQGSISDMGLALQQSAAVARLAGLNVEETVTLITQLAQAGLRGSDAGTSLRTALIRLINPTGRARDLLEELNVQLRDAEGNIRPEVFSDLTVALEDMSRAQRDAALATIFGQDALRAASILGRDGAAAYRETAAAISEEGLAAELAGARTQGLAGSFEALKNAADSAGILLGSLAAGPLKLYADAVANTLSDTAEFADELKGLGVSAADSTPGVRTAKDSIVDLGTSVAKTAFQFQLMGPAVFAASKALDQFTTSTQESGDELSVFDKIAAGVTETLDALGDALRKAGASITIPKDSGLNVRQIENVVSGFDEREVRARISGDTDALIAVLQQEQDFLEQQLDREFVQRRPELRRKLEQALLGVTNDLASISQDAANKKKSAASALEAAQNKADQDLLNALSAGRARQENRIAIAEQTTGLQDDIRAQVGLKRLLIRQIAVINEQVQDERAKASAILSLTTALIATNGAIKRLRAQQKQQRQDTVDQIQELNIQIAEERGNDAALERAIRARIATLNKQIKAAKGDQVRVKQLILERERLKNQLKDLNKADQETRNSFKTFVFEQLQAQQGFAANLLGNIIRGPTTGLVGVPAPAPTLPNVDDAIRVGQGTAAARQGGSPTAGQQNTVIALLERILTTLKQANRADASPEAKYQRREGSSVMDGIGGGGTNAVM